MSTKLLNAVIALIEDRPSIAREMLQCPETKFSLTINEVEARLFKAIDRREASSTKDTLKKVLYNSLRLKAEEGLTQDQEEAFYSGIAAVETIIESIINDIETINLPEYNT